MEQVAAGTTIPVYNREPPFHPDTSFPELPFAEVSSQPNAPYGLLRNLFFQLNYDRENFNAAGWNPLSFLIKPGQTVVLKPNFVLSFNSGGGDIFAVITHPSILRALIDYVYIALKGKGRIIIADAPQMDCNWEELMLIQQLDKVQEFYRSKFNFGIEIYDLRNFSLINANDRAYSYNRKDLPGDPQGNAVINLGAESEFYDLPNQNYYGADFNRDETIIHHNAKTHEYSISKTILSADVFISAPKMKVHKKVGVTLNLKGLVGINTNKNYLIHYRIGTPREGGDQLPDQQPASDRFIVKIQRFFYDKALARNNRLGDMIYKTAVIIYRITLKPFKQLSASTLIQDEGNWHGNDSAWRMTADLAKILFFADKQGILHNTPQRKIFCVIDGIMGGENNGPLSPDAKAAGCLVCGSNPLAVDLAAARLMGFDYKKIKKFPALLNLKKYNFGVKDVADIRVISEDREAQSLFSSGSKFFNFKPHPGWIGHIEI